MGEESIKKCILVSELSKKFNEEYSLLKGEERRKRLEKYHKDIDSIFN